MAVISKWWDKESISTPVKVRLKKKKEEEAHTKMAEENDLIQPESDETGMPRIAPIFFSP